MNLAVLYGILVAGWGAQGAAGVTVGGGRASGEPLPPLRWYKGVCAPIPGCPC